MAKNKLTNLEVLNLSPKASHYSVSDGGGLYIKVYPNGRKQWILRKSSNGKASNTPLGDYPKLSIADARTKASELAASFVDGRKHTEERPMLFGELVDKWLETKNIRQSTLYQLKSLLKTLYPLYTKELKSITAIEARQCVMGLVNNEHIARAKMVLGLLAQIERFGMALGLVDFARLQYIHTTLPKHFCVHRRSVTADRLPELFEIAKSNVKYNTDKIDILKALCLTLGRIKEVVSLRYAWIDLDEDIITIPAEFMKCKREHRIPICRQLHQVLVRRADNSTGFVFPSSRPAGHLCANVSFKRMGIGDLICSHGFRSMGRSWMALNGYDFAASEYCLAHTVENSTQAAYQRYDYLEQRRKIMQDWGDYVEKCYSPFFPEG